MTHSPQPISVIVRTFNSAGTLDTVLSRLDFEEGDEVVIVDSGSTDETLAIAEKYESRVIHAGGKFNYSRSLNLGFEAALHEWVLVISSHSIPVGVDLLSTFRESALNLPEDVLVIYGPSRLSGKSDVCLFEKSISFLGFDDYYKGAFRICTNANTLYRLSAWRLIAFDETVRTAEDKLWLQAIIERGFRFAYLPKAATVNENRGSLKYMFWKGYSDAMASCPPLDTRPLRPWHFAGALKNHFMNYLGGEFSFGSCLRYSAHAMGQYLGSHRKVDNTRWE